MTRRSFACMCVLLLGVLAGCNSLQGDAQVSRDQWEPPLGPAATAEK
ncbi:hypothetical protein Pan44_40360 [Caulifigura coniformis]|uniref:Uncharacterized protein n=1 Tax=Caulifigura coniformis TaxID=2527983 RepID=A0A517SIP2_9PLAN|nr:hypothetical protein [Caulifigura coniformis]QDT55987.1 hypothetical protein Pan44_40360 [Caulifigura coniformis]